MKAMILAAGRGERLRPLTDVCPKPLIHAGPKPLIVHHIEKLKNAGILDIWINTAWLGKMIQDTLGHGQDFGVNIHYSDEQALFGQALDTAGGIAQIADLLGPDPFLVISADIVTDFDFTLCHQISKALAKSQNMGHLVLVDNPDGHSLGDFVLDNQGYIGLPNDHNILDCLTFSSIALFKPDIFIPIGKGTQYRLKDALAPYIKQKKITGQYYQGIRIDVGTQERLAYVNRLISEGT